MSRPEHKAPPEIFYNEDEARKYTLNSRIMDIQVEMAERAFELLLLPEDKPSLILDLGCGSGLSGSVLDDHGHYWVGVDISEAMLDVGKEKDCRGDLILSDLGTGMPFRAGSFDSCISISTLQWLCNADKTCNNPRRRLYTLFSTLYSTLSRTARAVFQFYPENQHQIDLITTQALRAGFYGGVVVDYPHSAKAKKYYLVLMTGGQCALPEGLTDDHEQRNHVQYTNKREKDKRSRGKSWKMSKEYIIAKKERCRRQGKEVRQDTKYTGRKRKPKF